MTENRYGHNAEIKEWFEGKLAEEMHLGRMFYLRLFCKIKETEKAVYAMCFTGYNGAGNAATRRCAWMPKSAIENFESLPMIADYDEAVAAFQSHYTM